MDSSSPASKNTPSQNEQRSTLTPSRSSSTRSWPHFGHFMKCCCCRASRSDSASSAARSRSRFSRAIRAVSSSCFSFSRNHWSSRLPSFSRSEEHTSELQSRLHLVCRLLLEKKKQKKKNI